MSAQPGGTRKSGQKIGSKTADLTELKKSLNHFYSKREHADKVLPILNRQGPVSGRLLEYFVVNFSKQNKVSYQHQGVVIDVHESYETQLKTYHKAFFDPFKRTEKCMWEFAGKEKHLVTLGQLCFLKWVVATGILDYIERNIQRISQAMKSRPKAPPRTKPTEGRRSRSRRQSPAHVTARRARALVGDRWVIHFD
jgi:hypothetical protein